MSLIELLTSKESKFVLLASIVGYIIFSDLLSSFIESLSLQFRASILVVILAWLYVYTLDKGDNR